MRRALLLVFVASLLTVAGETAVAAPQSTGKLMGPPKGVTAPLICEVNIFGKGMFNGTTCEPVVELFTKGLEKNPCSEGCVLVASSERGHKVLPAGKRMKVGDECDWALYDCMAPLPKVNNPGDSTKKSSTISN